MQQAGNQSGICVPVWKKKPLGEYEEYEDPHIFLVVVSIYFFLQCLDLSLKTTHKQKNTYDKFTYLHTLNKTSEPAQRFRK